jgi:transcriptional regulator with XRE-family HTH domain
MRHFDGTRLRQIRTQHGITPATLASRVDRSSQSISRYELGLTQPPTAVLCALADALGVDPGDLLTSHPS